MCPNNNLDENKAESDIAMELLNPNKSIDLKIKEMFVDLPSSFSIVLVIPRAQHDARCSRLIKYLVEKGFEGIYVTINKSTNELLEEMKKNEVDSKKISFVDAVTKMVEGKQIEGDQFTYLESPSDMLELSIGVDNAINSISSKKAFIVIDSITTLLIYNKDVSVEKFLHALSQKISDLGFVGFFFASESTNKELLDIISQFCDDIKSL